jgi:hypothetical protein
MKKVIMSILLCLAAGAKLFAEEATGTQAPAGGLGDWLGRSPTAVFILAFIIWRIGQSNRQSRK